MIDTAGTLNWYALSVQTQYEKAVDRNLTAKGYETFLPLIRRKQRRKDSLVEINAPLFPSYVLVRLDPRKRLPILKIPAVYHFVSIDRQPCPIPEDEIETIRAVVDSTERYGPWPFVRAGDRVRVGCGSLIGLEGFVVKCDGTQKLIVSLNLLQRSVAVEIDRDWVEPLGTPEVRPIPLAKSGSVGAET